MILELSICALGIEKYAECRDISLKILNIKDLPNYVKADVEKNLKLANLKILENQEKPIFEKEKDIEKIEYFKETIIFFSCN